MGYRAMELHRVYPALTEDTVTGNGTGERAVTGGETALAEATARAALAEARLFDFKTMLDDIREQRGGTRDHGSAKGTRAGQHQSWRTRRATSCFYGLWASCVGAFCWSP